MAGESARLIPARGICCPMPENSEISPYDGLPPTDNPGCKPFLWFVGSIVALIVLGEVLLEFGWELAELIGEGIFYVVEGSEEFLEDAVEDWFQLEPWEAEMYTAWSMLPVKIFLGLVVLRALWLWKKRKVWPLFKAWAGRKWWLVRLSWRGIWWPYKLLISIFGLGVMVILI
jgi:hypothetical protein